MNSDQPEAAVPADLSIEGDVLSVDQRLELLRGMLLIRTVEETIAERYQDQEMRCPTHLSSGQEAVAVGVCSALEREDQAFSGHRAHAHYLAKGGNLGAMLAEIHGKATGCSKGKGGSMHLVDRAAGFVGSTAIVGGTIPLAVGAALSSTLLERGQVTCAFFGDAAVEEGVFYESVNFAVVRRLPVMFVCENNLYSVYSPLRVRQPPERSIAQMVSSFGLPVLAGDGNDVEDVYRKALAGRRHAVERGGPVFLEFSTYRWREHCGPNYDNDLGYRTPEEFDEWRARDPVAAYKQQLAAEGHLDASAYDAMVEQSHEEVAEAFSFARRSPLSDPGEVLTEVYARDEGNP